MNAFPRRVGNPIAEPFTLAEALIHLRETADGGANDAYITSLISVARATCEERTERTMVSTAWRLKMDGFCDAIELFRPPVIAVQAVTYLDVDGVLQTVNAADYMVDSANEPGFLMPDVGVTWPETQDGAVNAVTVDYTAGYGATGASVPAPLRHWMLCALTYLYENRAADLPQGFADGLIGYYRVVGV